MRFSSRLHSTKNRALIFDDAPRSLRIGYIKGMLGEFVGDQINHRKSRPQPLDSQETHNKFIALIREERETWSFDGDSHWERLCEHLKCCAWSEFFDFVELLGKLLIESDDNIPFESSVDFRTYREKVNNILTEDGIGWLLNESSELHRRQNKKISAIAKSAEASMDDRFLSAKMHYLKSEKYLYQYPSDEANSIKEIISAIESATKVIDPRIKTLGEATKKLRANQAISTHLLDALEKINVYANATPQIRHGHTETSGPTSHEAELIFVIGVAYIRYLISVSKDEAPQQKADK